MNVAKRVKVFVEREFVMLIGKASLFLGKHYGLEDLERKGTVLTSYPFIKALMKCSEEMAVFPRSIFPRQFKKNMAAMQEMQDAYQKTMEDLLYPPAPQKERMSNLDVVLAVGEAAAKYKYEDPDKPNEDSSVPSWTDECRTPFTF